MMRRRLRYRTFVARQWRCVVFLACGLAWTATAAPIRLAVAPFEGDSADASIATALTDRLATHSVERLIAPDALVASAQAEPAAARVRQWAYNAAVSAIVVGRVVPASSGDHAAAREVEVTLRSGHSGGEISRHTMTILNGGSLDASLAELASRILSDLEFDPAAVDTRRVGRDPRSPEPTWELAADATAHTTTGANANSDAVDANGDASGDGAFEFGKLEANSPIEIKADEAEIQDRDEGRLLFFQRNVFVRQGDVTLASDELEATYRKGQSEPDKLIARGSVQVDQGQRSARCDRAVYMRVEQRLTCEGRAELIQGCDVVRGESIEFDLASDQAQVRGAASIVIRPGAAETSGCASVGETL